MKKKILSLGMVLLTCFMVGCTTHQDTTPDDDTKKDTQESTDAPVATASVQASRKTYNILSIDTDAHALSLDEIEWLTPQNTIRLKELNLNADQDFQNGFYLYNEAVEPISVPVEDIAEFIYLDYENNFADVQTDYDGFLEHYTEIQEQNPALVAETPYEITITEGEISLVAERYVP